MYDTRYDANGLRSRYNVQRRISQTLQTLQTLQTIKTLKTLKTLKTRAGLGLRLGLRLDRCSNRRKRTRGAPHDRT